MFKDLIREAYGAMKHNQRRTALTSGARSQIYDFFIGAGTISRAGPSLDGWIYLRSLRPASQCKSRKGVSFGPNPAKSSNLPRACRMRSRCPRALAAKGAA